MQEQTPATTYQFKVAARDAAGNTSAQSTALSVTTLIDSVAPSVPGKPTSSAQTMTSITLNWTASTDKLKAIAIQKWIALTNFSGMEAWTEYRRTNLPNIPQALTVTDAKRPLRLFYPSTESGSNSNVADQGAIDVFTTKIFWDVD